eukprot:scaffold8518_cov135-Isochrysis_galbana.AAC.4
MMKACSPEMGTANREPGAAGGSEPRSSTRRSFRANHQARRLRAAHFTHQRRSGPGWTRHCAPKSGQETQLSGE